ncbi:MAG TPA: outer membrane beta-barrel protein [Chitinophagaceae bacterium]|nr:outer membrane beta-barrel protein [Chitinophagaceae bacterium]
MFTKKNRLLLGVVRFGTAADDQSGINNTRINYYQSGVFNYADTIDQEKTFTGNSRTFGTKLTFSEPLSAAWFAVLEYAYNKNHSNSNRNTFEKGLNGKYEVPIVDFSDNFGLDAFSHSGTGTLRYAGKKIKFAFGTGVSAVKLVLNDLDTHIITDYHFLKLTPQAQFNFTLKQQTNLSVSYRGTTRQPTLNQLQPLRDNTDPLNIYRGNPDLKVGFNHGFNINFNQYKVLSQTGIYIGSGFNLQDNAITQFNTIDDQGKRTYFPVNVNGNLSWYLYGNWNKGGGENKLDYSIELNSRGGRNINFVNGLKSINYFTSVLATFSIEYEQVDKYSFELYPMIGYNWSSSSLGTSINNNYLTYGGQFSGYMMLPGKLEISTNINADLRQRIDAFAQNTNLVIWNAGLTRKFGKDKAGKIGLYVNDILDDNKGFTRTINSNFITDERYLRVSRYFLLKLEWSFTKMPGAEKK